MRFSKTGRRGVALTALAAATTLFAAGCSAGSLGSSSGEGSAGATTITFLTGATDTDVASAKAVISAFQAANPNITIKHDTRPAGSEGDNLVKTRLSTGEMSEVFIYNNGSLLQAIKPEQNLTPWMISRGRARSIRSSPSRRRAPTARSTAIRTERRSVAGCCTTSRSTRNSTSRYPRPGMSS